MGKELKHDEWLIEHVKDEERELKQMEKQLEKHMEKLKDSQESWSADGENDKHTHIHMAPLRHHTPGANKEMSNIFKDLHNLIKGKIDSISKTGPAKDHHMKNILPTHNMFKPGAHPSQKKNDEKKDEHKKEEHHDTKAEELKNRLKPIRIEWEYHGVRKMNIPTYDNNVW